ncbi:hypothetical protein [Nostoc piscinale]|uniref:hypothetical protein n=1 Tax=Nostoc piscinale TaxID=224012 RepID=UPI0039A4B8EA
MKKPKSLDFTKEQQNNSPWPIWFPYPSSWIRAFILVILAFPGTNLIIFGLVGIIISILGNSPGLLIFFIFSGLLLPTICLTFLYHIFWFFWQKQELNRKLPKWMPNLNSLWEGFYGSIVMALSFLIILTIFTQVAFSACHTYYGISSELSRCAGRLTGYTTRTMLNSIESNSFIDRYWFIIWIITASYLYQIEYLAKKYLVNQFKNKFHTFKDKHIKHRVDDTDKELDRLRADLGLTQMKKGKQRQRFIHIQSGLNYHNYQNIHKVILISLLICLGVLGIYSLVKFIYIQDNTPVAVTYQTPSTKESKPQTDNFREAVNQAINAANLTQSAKSPTEWQNIVKQWETAISLMQSVPSSSPNYAVAQQKIVEYRRNLSYAQKNATSSQ